jgi:hypothetical protein
MLVSFRVPVEDPAVGFALQDSDGHVVFATSSAWTHSTTGSFKPGDTLVMRVGFEAVLRPGKYLVTPSVARLGAGANVLDKRDQIASIQVTGSMVTGGVVDLPHDLEIERVPAGQPT